MANKGPLGFEPQERQTWVHLYEGLSGSIAWPQNFSELMICCFICVTGLPYWDLSLRAETMKSLYLCKRGFYFYKRVFEKLCLFNITCQRPCCLHLCCLKVCVSWKASSQRTCAVIAIFLESIPCENMLTWPIFFEHCLLENIISVFSKHRKYVPACIQINLMTFCFFPEKDLQLLR